MLSELQLTTLNLPVRFCQRILIQRPNLPQVETVLGEEEILLVASFRQDKSLLYLQAIQTLNISTLSDPLVQTGQEANRLKSSKKSPISKRDRSQKARNLIARKKKRKKSNSNSRVRKLDSIPLSSDQASPIKRQVRKLAVSQCLPFTKPI